MHALVAVAVAGCSCACVNAHVASGGVKVIGAGFGRTGTQSLQLGLDALGFRCFHTKNFASEPSQIARWNEVTHSRQHAAAYNFSRVFEDYGYTATVDFPSCMYYRELMQHYPKAKVVLSVRDSGAQWYNSARRLPLAFHRSVPPEGMAQTG